MRIGIDISQIVYGTGVSVYTKNLVENLLRIDRENEYILFFSSLRRNIKYQISNIKNTNQKAKIKRFKLPPTLLDFLWNRLHIMPIEKLIGSIDVFHTSDWTEPPAKCPKVTTIHDLTPLLFPKDVHHKIVATHKRKLEWVKKETSLIIAVSKATKRDIIRLLDIPEEKIKVIYEAPSFSFTSEVSPRRRRGPSTSEVFRIKKKYGLSDDYLLAFAGSVRKNLERVKMASLGFQIFIVGQPYVPIDDLPALYSGALCLVYPSLYEGFGLPILEAMACGCPVVTSNVSSMPEVAGNAAVLVNPKSVEGIAQGIKKVLDNKDELIKRGFKQVRLFSWEKTAKETLKVYQELGSSINRSY